MTEKKTAPKKSNGYVVMTNDELTRIIVAGGLSSLNNRELPAKPTYWIGVITDKVESAWKHYRTAREKILKQFAKLDKTGEIIYKDEAKTLPDIPAESMEQLNKELEILNEQEIEFSMKKMDSTLLSLAEQLEEKDINLKPIELSALRHFYKE
jgi:hypothetical protein